MGCKTHVDTIPSLTLTSHLKISQPTSGNIDHKTCYGPEACQQVTVGLLVYMDITLVETAAPVPIVLSFSGHS